MSDILKPNVELHLMSDDNGAVVFKENVKSFNDGGVTDLYSPVSDDVPTSSEPTDMYSTDDVKGKVKSETKKPELKTEAEIVKGLDANDDGVTLVADNTPAKPTDSKSADEAVKYSSALESAKAKVTNYVSIEDNAKIENAKVTKKVEVTVKDNVDKVIGTADDENNKSTDDKPTAGEQVVVTEMKAEKLDIDQLKDKSFNKYGKDIVFMSYFKTNEQIKEIFKDPILANKVFLSKKEDLWKDPFIQKSFIDDYGTSAHAEFEKVYDGIADRYKRAKSDVAQNTVREKQLKSKYLTGNKIYDLFNTSNEEEVKSIAKLYDDVMPDLLDSYTSESTYVGHQFMENGILSGTDYNTAYDAALDYYRDELGRTYKVNESSIAKVEQDDKWFKVRSDIDNVNLTDIGFVHMNLVNNAQRNRLDDMLVSKYEISDKPLFASALRHSRKLAMNGWGDYSSILLSAAYKTGLDLVNSAYSFYDAAASITGSDENSRTTTRHVKNWIRKYTPGRTYHARQNMWSLENVLDGAASGLMQIGVAYGLGAGLKGVTGFAGAQASSLTAQFGTRAILTMYGTGTVYDSFRDNGFSERESGLFSMTAFLGMWWANGLSDWVSDGFTNKAAMKELKTYIEKRITPAIAIAKSDLPKQARLDKAFKFFTSKEGGFGKALDKAANNRYVGGIAKLNSVKNGIKEGAEEMTEDFFNEVNQQAANFYAWTNKEDGTDRDYFARITDDGYWGDYASNTLFSGTIGGITGALPGGVKDIKNVVNRKLRDIKPQHIESALDVINGNHEADFFSLVAKLRENGELGAEDVLYDGSKGNVGKDDMSQAAFNASMLVSDVLITKKALGESMTNEAFQSSVAEVNFDLALESKETMRELLDIYKEHDLVYSDYAQIDKIGFTKFNAKRIADNKEALTEETRESLGKLNGRLKDLQDGTAYRAMFMQKAVANDNVFGSSENRVEMFKGEQFNDLLYGYFKGLLSNHKVNFDDLTQKLNILKESESVVINGSKLTDSTPLEDVPKFLAEYAKSGVIDEKAMIILQKKAEEYLLKSTEYETMLSGIGKFYTDRALDGISAYANDNFGDISGVVDIDKEIALLETTKKDAEGKDIAITEDDKKKIERLEKFKIISESIATLEAATPEELLAIGKSYQVNDNKDISELKISEDSKKSITSILDNSLINSIKGQNAITIGSQFVRANKQQLAGSMKIISVPMDNLNIEGYGAYSKVRADISSELNSIDVDDKESIQKRIDNDVSYLDRILDINTDGTVSVSDTNIGKGMYNLTKEIQELVDDNMTPEEEAEFILSKSYEKDELLNKSYSILLHTKFLNIMSKNLRNLNYVNNVINKAQTDSLLQARPSLWETNGGLRWIQSNFWFKTNTKYTLHSDFKNPERNVLMKDMQVEIDELILKLKSDSISDEQRSDYESKLLLLRNETYSNFFDYDRKIFLEKKATRTEKEEEELNNFIEKERVLKTPSLELMKYMFVGENEHAEAIVKHKESLSSLEGDIEKASNEIKSKQDIIARVNGIITDNQNSTTVDPDYDEAYYNEMITTINEDIAALTSLMDENANTNIPDAKKSIIESEAKLQESMQEKLDALNQEQEVWEREYNKVGLTDLNRKVLNDNEPYKKFFKDVLDFNNTSLSSKLKFFEGFFEKSNQYTVKDKAIIANMMFDVLSTEEEKSKKAGIGANYEGNVKKNYNNFVSNINTMLDKDNLKCK